MSHYSQIGYSLFVRTCESVVRTSVHVHVDVTESVFVMEWLMCATFVMLRRVACTAAKALLVEGGSSSALLDELSVVILGNGTDVSSTSGC